jgi:hypothetical protein
MKTLPFDCQRCKPDNPSYRCEMCLRWVDLPGQTFGPRTAYVIVYGPGESGCRFVEKYDER